MNTHRSLTRLAHQLLASALHPGDLVIDATAGNGHDTLFLAQRVAPAGAVYAFDIETRALDSTALRLYQADLRDLVTLCHIGHEQMLGRIPREWPGKVAAIVFNLGYLPGSDKLTATTPQSTLQALDQSLQLLKPGGALSVISYRGHAGGRYEADSVEQWIRVHQAQLVTQRYESPGPVLHYCVLQACAGNTHDLR